MRSNAELGELLTLLAVEDERRNDDALFPVPRIDVSMEALAAKPVRIDENNAAFMDPRLQFLDLLL